jgi:uncharacterized protein (DUF427 family)
VSLSTGRGPFSANPAGRFNVTLPPQVVYVEPFRRRVRGVGGGRTLVDSERVVLVHRPGQPPSYAFPPDDAVGVGAEADPDAQGYVRVPWDAVEHWYEEDEEVLGHPRNPYHRIDCLRSHRRLRVEVAGAVLTDTTATVVLYETALEPRLYVAREAVGMELLSKSETRTYCPYKGTASYFHARVGDLVVEDVAWSYEDPLAESQAIAGLLSFDARRASVTEELPAG